MLELVEDCPAGGSPLGCTGLIRSAECERPCPGEISFECSVFVIILNCL